MTCNEKNEISYLPDEEISISNEELFYLEQDIRLERNRLLSECDWTQLPDSPLSEEEKAIWRVYRQALRDITKQEGFPLNVVFPHKPV